MFTKASTELGFHPFPRPTSQMSKPPFVNIDGQQLGQCQYCGYCEKVGPRIQRQGQPAHHRHPGGR